MNASNSALEKRVAAGDESALAELFDVYRGRLRKIVDSRMDRRLQGRVDPSDVLQEAFLDLNKRLPAYVRNKDKMSMFVWMRLVAKERVLIAHRKHLNAEKRDARREKPLDMAGRTNASSMFLAEHLLGQFSTAGHKAIRQEMYDALLTALNSMDAIDHEIITMRCFEELTNAEAAEALELSENGASRRFVRAMTRLKQRLTEVSGFL